MAIRSMPKTARIICRLVWVDGYSAADASAILKIPESTVRGAIKEHETGYSRNHRKGCPVNSGHRDDEASRDRTPIAEVYEQIEDRVAANYRRHVDVTDGLTEVQRRTQQPSYPTADRPAGQHQPGDDPAAVNATPTTGVLLSQACEGDPRAWDELVNRHTRLLWSIGRAYRLDTADAADAVQTTWLRLLEHLHHIQDPDRLVGWLGTTMRRECLRILRRAGRERARQPDLVALAAPDPDEPVDAAQIRADRDRQLWEAFNRMPDRCRLLLRIMIANPPPPYEEIAALLGIPIGSIGPTRARCLTRLRAILDRTEDLPPPPKHNQHRHPPTR
jgi:RNA polymerase sigma factor (sigma-70 family)